MFFFQSMENIPISAARVKTMGDEGQPRDHATAGDETGPDRDGASARGDLENNVKSRATWLRLLFMIVFALIFAIVETVAGAVVVLQFFFVLFTGGTNDRLRSFGQSLATYAYRVLLYLTYNTDERPFPFDQDWPS